MIIGKQPQRSTSSRSRVFLDQNLFHWLARHGECGDGWDWHTREAVLFLFCSIYNDYPSLQFQNIPKHDREMVKEYGKVYGTFQGTKPTLNINDTKLIRSVFVKDFDHFINRRVMIINWFFSPEFIIIIIVDMFQKIEFPEMKVFRYMLSSMENQPWKDVRSAVTPTFTSGKIKRVLQSCQIHPPLAMSKQWLL